MKTILVTGGAGYIGSHTAKALAQSGYRPIALDNLSTGHRWAVKWGPLLEGDLADRELVLRALVENGVDAVIHFAASAEVAESMADPYKYFRNNVVNSMCLLEAMHEAGVRHIVFSSTCATYGVPTRVPISETDPQIPANPYGESKLFVERALDWHGRLNGLHWVALRYFNAAGADPDGQLGEVHNPESHLIPLVIRAALGECPPVRILGTDYPTPDGTAIRDYVHVSDLAAAHVQALDYMWNGGASSAFNLGTGKGHSVREVVAAVAKVSGSPVPFEEVERRPGDPAILVADTRRAKRALGWKPTQSALGSIVRTAWDWHTQIAPVKAQPAATPVWAEI
jgi:UDP-arabinose 4-epimerase